MFLNLGNRLRAQYTDFQYLPADLLLPGDGTAPKLTPDFIAMRAVLDRINLLTRKASPLVPAPHSADLFPFVDVTVKPMSNELAMQHIMNFVDAEGLTNVTGYHPLQSSSVVADGNQTITLDACLIARWNYEVSET